MKKFLCTFLLIAVFAGSAFAGSVNVGLLTQLNMTQSRVSDLHGRSFVVRTVDYVHY